MGIYVLFTGLFFLPLCFGLCSNKTVTVTSNSPRGKNKFVYLSGDTAKITINYKCHTTKHSESSIRWSNPGDNATEGRYLYFIESTQNIGDGDKKYSGKDMGLILSMSNSTFNLTITIPRVNSSHDTTSIRLVDRETNEIISEAILEIVCCDRSKLPNGLVMNGTDVKSDTECPAEIYGACRSGEMFLQGFTNFYLPRMKLSCHVSGAWNNPNVECFPSCVPQPNINLQVTNLASSLQYKAGTMLNLRCKRGKMYVTTAPDHFFEETETTCNSDEQWTDPGVSCWEGQTVPFDSETTSLLSTKATIFNCSARNPLVAQIVVGKTTVKEDGNAWVNITMTPEHNGIEASCKEIDGFKFVIHNHKTILDVKFPPELTVPVSSDYGFIIGTTNHVEVKFRTNPPLTLGDINVTKNSSVVTNLYLTVNGTAHIVVLHFTKVAPHDFGKYVITITSRNPVAKKLMANFTITSNKAPPTAGAFGKLGDIAAVILGIILIAAIVGVFVAQARSMKKKTGDIKAVDRTERAVVYEADGDNYENPNKFGKDQSQSQKSGGYVNVNVGVPKQNPYVVPKRAAQRPPVPPHQARSPPSSVPGRYRQSAASFGSFVDDVYES